MDDPTRRPGRRLARRRAMTLFAAWSWVLGRWRVLAGPVATITAIVVRVTVGDL